jgi:hypothetical protein
MGVEADVRGMTMDDRRNARWKQLRTDIGGFKIG